VGQERRTRRREQRREPVRPGLSAWTLFLPSGMQLTLGFQATPVVCHCLTYFCKVSSSSENAFAQAIAAGLLGVSLSRPVSLPTQEDLRLFELLGDPIRPELSGVLHLAHERRRCRFLSCQISGPLQRGYDLRPEPIPMRIHLQQLHSGMLPTLYPPSIVRGYPCLPSPFQWRQPAA
jgi:hypothetical protein